MEYRGKGRIFGAAFGNLANKSFPLNRIQALNAPLYSISDLLQGLIDLFPSCQEHKDISSGLLRSQSEMLDWDIGRTHLHMYAEYRLDRCFRIIHACLFQVAHLDRKHSTFEADH